MKETKPTTPRLRKLEARIIAATTGDPDFVGHEANLLKHSLQEVNYILEELWPVVEAAQDVVYQKGNYDAVCVLADALAAAE